MMIVRRQVRSPRLSLVKNKAEAKQISDDISVPIEVYSLILHAQTAIKEGDLDRADSALELALRRLER